MPVQVMRSMKGIGASSNRFEWWSSSFCTTLKMPGGVSTPAVPLEMGDFHHLALGVVDRHALFAERPTATSGVLPIERRSLVPP